jgi:hypothetical protein
MWGAVALTLLVAGLYLIRPLLSHKPQPLRSWGLVIGTASEQNPQIKEFGTFLRMYVTARHGCDKPVPAEGDLEWTQGLRSRYSPGQLAPRRIALGVAGAEVVGGEIRYPYAHGWIDLAVRHVSPFESTLLYSPRFPKLRQHVRAGVFSTLGKFRFRLFVDGAQSSGYGSCELANPVLLVHPGESAVMAEAMTALDALEADSPPGQVAHERVINEAVVWSSIPGKRPDPSTLGSQDQIRNGRVLTGCGEDLTASPPKLNIYEGSREFFESPTCGGVNRFEALGSQDTLTRNAFFGGILISAALGLLLEVAVTGATGRRLSQGA